MEGPAVPRGEAVNEYTRALLSSVKWLAFMADSTNTITRDIIRKIVVSLKAIKSLVANERDASSIVGKKMCLMSVSAITPKM